MLLHKHQIAADISIFVMFVINRQQAFILQTKRRFLFRVLFKLILTY